MTTSETINIVIATAALIVSFASAVYIFRTNTKKYELSEDIRKEILNWYEKCINVLVLLRNELEINDIEETKVRDLNASLYSLTELGRFYFPNYNRDQGKGSNKSAAYKGNRALLIDLLAESYKITSISTNDFQKRQAYYINELTIYQKGFTSEMFLFLDPDSFIQKQMTTAKIVLLHRKTFSESEYEPNNREKA